MGSTDNLQETPRDRLTAAGLALFGERGVNAVGIKDIVGAANMPKGSFYYYFDSKDAFAAATVARYASEEAAAIGEVARYRGDDPIGFLRRYFENAHDRFASAGFRRGCLLGAMGSEMADHSEAVRERLGEAFAAWRGGFVEVLQRARDAGQIAPESEPTQLADALIDAWQGALVRMKVERSAAPLHRFTTVTFDALVRR